MRRIPRFTAFLLLVILALPDFWPPLSAQNAALTPQQLDQLLSPIALYPDSLLSQIMTASTNPQEILDVDNWLYEHSNLTGTALTDAAQQQGFDPAFIALVNFPQIIEMMAQHVDDYAAIGQAFQADQGAVTDSIQRLRAQAYAVGSLRSNAQQTVEVQQAPGQTIYVIQPANPQVVYVPSYDPTVVYVRPSSGVVTAGVITFGAGIAIGALMVDRPWGWPGWGWNWGARRVYYNRAVWVGWGTPYRPPRPWYRPRPIYWTHRPGYGGNWRYRPPNYRPPMPGNRPGYGRPPYGPGNRPGYRPPAAPPGRPSAPNRPGAPPPKPGPPPAGRPPGNRPQQPNRPPTSGPGSGHKPGPPPGENRPTKPPQSQPKPDGPNRPSGRPPSQSGNERRPKDARD